MDIKQLFQSVPPFVGSKGLVFIDDSYVLICERDSGAPSYPNHDDLPGGYREANETPFENFQRELREELGVHVSPQEISYGIKLPDVDNETEDLYFMVANLHQDKRADIKFGDEGRGYKAIHLDKVLTDTKLIPRHRQMVQEYLSYLENHRQPLGNKPAHLADHLQLA